MFCKKCGKNIDDDSKFCQYCGTIIDAPVMTTTKQLVKSNQQLTGLISNKKQMHCYSCHGSHLEVVEESYRFCYFIGILSAILKIIGICLLFYGLYSLIDNIRLAITSTKSSSTSEALYFIVGSLLYFLGQAISLIRPSTSRTKVICMHCGKWHFLEDYAQLMREIQNKELDKIIAEKAKNTHNN